MELVKARKDCGVFSVLSSQFSVPGSQFPFAVLWSCILCGLNHGGLGTFGFADLFGSEAASAGAATPIIGRAAGLVLGAPGLHQFATALGTLSLRHSLVY